jgi:hypothetical protein
VVPLKWRTFVAGVDELWGCFPPQVLAIGRYELPKPLIVSVVEKRFAPSGEQQAKPTSQQARSVAPQSSEEHLRLN